jgi:hypothetical protein
MLVSYLNFMQITIEISTALLSHSGSKPAPKAGIHPLVKIGN